MVIKVANGKISRVSYGNVAKVSSDDELSNIVIIYKKGVSVSYFITSTCVWWLSANRMESCNYFPLPYFLNFSFNEEHWFCTYC